MKTFLKAIWWYMSRALKMVTYLGICPKEVTQKCRWTVREKNIITPILFLQGKIENTVNVRHLRNIREKAVKLYYIAQDMLTPRKTT